MVGRTIARGATRCKIQMLRNTAKTVMVTNGMMVTSIGPDTVQPAGVGDAASTQEPMDGDRKKEASGAAPGCRQRASSGDQRTPNTKEARVPPKEKRSQSSSSCAVDSCAIFIQEEFSEYVVLTL